VRQGLLSRCAARRGSTLKIISFTASRQGFFPPPALVTNVLAALDANVYVTGACQGGDAFIGQWLRVNRPGAEHVVIVPADRSRVHAWWLEHRGVLIEEMPPGTTYADRNSRLMKLGHEVTAFPAWPEDDPRSARSGTWQAVRMAKKAGKPVAWHCVLPPFDSGIAN
jgi:hypothetical protein